MQTVSINDYVTIEKCQTIMTKLVKTNTTHPKGNEMDAVNVILSFFEPYPISYEIIDHGANRGSLVITIPGKDSSKAIGFLGHIDTVPVEDELEWKYRPLDAAVDGDYMYGRGTADMKGGVTSMILTASYILEHQITPPCDLLFCFTADEELDGMGILSVKEAGYFDKVTEIFIPEPTNDSIGIAEKGALWLAVSVEGLSAHGSRPDLGVNAVENLIEFINNLKEEIDTETKHPLLGETTISVTTFTGGVKTNVIPTNAKASLDIRTLPSVKHDELIHTANIIADRMMNKAENLTITINVENNRPAIETDRESTFIKKLEAVYHQLSYEPKFKGLYFYTDGSQVIPDFPVPFVILGPGDDAMAHVRNERISLSSVAKMAEIYISYVLKAEHGVENS